MTFDLISHFAEDLCLSTTKIALAIDRIRIQELQRLRLPAVSIKA